MATLGLRDLFYAKVTLVAGKETYAKPKRLAKAVTANLDVDIAEEKLSADDGVDLIERDFNSGTVKLKVNDLDNEAVQEILDQHVDGDGVLYGGEDDDPPYFAIAFRAKKPGGQYRYLWLYKVKFKIPSESFETKGQGITIITPEIEGEFLKRDSDGLWKADYVGKPSDAVAAKWFEEVREPKTEEEE